MTVMCEAFYDSDVQIGVLLRDEQPGELATFIAFQMEDGQIFRAEQVTEIGPAPTDWSAFRFAEDLGGAVVTGVRIGSEVSVDGVLVDGDAVPSYLGHRILVDLAQQGGTRTRFRQLDEHGGPELHDVEIVGRAPEEMTLPGVDGVVVAMRYELLLDGEPYSSFWWDGERVVASDWTAGSMSVAVDDLEDALAGCPVQIAEHARQWVAGRP